MSPELKVQHVETQEEENFGLPSKPCGLSLVTHFCQGGYKAFNWLILTCDDQIRQITYAHTGGWFVITRDVSWHHLLKAVYHMFSFYTKRHFMF